jgi:hypothetical protein
MKSGLHEGLEYKLKWHGYIHPFDRMCGCGTDHRLARGRLHEEDGTGAINYYAYLESPEWKAKRDVVLCRDRFLCQACRAAKATEAHHLTYEHLGREPLFDLIAVCRSCNARLRARPMRQTDQIWRRLERAIDDENSLETNTREHWQ